MIVCVIYLGGNLCLCCNVIECKMGVDVLYNMFAVHQIRPPREIVVIQILLLSNKAMDSDTCTAMLVFCRDMLVHVGPTQEEVVSLGTDVMYQYLASPPSRACC